MNLVRRKRKITSSSANIVEFVICGVDLLERTDPGEKFRPEDRNLETDLVLFDIYVALLVVAGLILGEIQRNI